MGKRGRPPYTRRERIKEYAHRFMLLWVAVRHRQAVYRVNGLKDAPEAERALLRDAGARSPRARALAIVAAENHMSVHSLRNLLKKGLRDVPSDVRTLLEPELLNHRETYQVYEEWLPRLGATRKGAGKP